MENLLTKAANRRPKSVKLYAYSLNEICISREIVKPLVIVKKNLTVKK